MTGSFAGESTRPKGTEETGSSETTTHLEMNRATRNLFLPKPGTIPKRSVQVHEYTCKRRIDPDSNLPTPGDWAILGALQEGETSN